MNTFVRTHCVFAIFCACTCGHLRTALQVVFDGAVFEGVGKLVVDLHPSNGILVPTVARLVAPHDTAKQHLSILRFVAAADCSCTLVSGAEA